MGDFLEPTEVSELRTNYTAWLNKLKPDEFVQKIYGEGIIEEYEYQKINAMSTTHDKNSHIFHDVLMKATYEDIEQVRRILLTSRQSGYKALAKLLPNRDPNFDYDMYDEYTPDNAPKKKKKPFSSTKSKAPKTVIRTCPEPEDNEVEMESEGYDELNLEEGPDSMMNEAYPSARTGGAPRSRQADPYSHPAANADYSLYQPMLKCYDVKPGNDPRKGKGMCAIIRNFTHELTGYAQDSARIREFFGGKLGYDIVADEYGLVDLSISQMRSKLIMMKGLLENQYDRFVLFILSHGDELGIKTCSPSDKKSEEKFPDGTPVRYPVDDIVELFSHKEEGVPNLKTFPKCFFIQACQGDKVAAPAAAPDRSQQITTMENDWEPPRHKLTDKADMLVCLPSQKGTYSWVPSTGSWFIQETIAIFEKYHQSEHILDMMVEVNRALSVRGGKGKVGNGPVIDVYQMPGLTCTLTQKFFLAIPPITPYVDKKK